MKCFIQTCLTSQLFATSFDQIANFAEGKTSSHTLANGLQMNTYSGACHSVMVCRWFYDWWFLI